MNVDKPQTVTAQQAAQAAIVTTFIENGGNLLWLPAKVKAAKLMDVCAKHSEFEDNDDFKHTAQQRINAHWERQYIPSALEWVQAHVTE
jgi:hypothetical protein